MRHPADSFDRQASRGPGLAGTEAAEQFVGRQWALNCIDAWLSAGHGRRFVVGGAPGTGKSRIAQRLVELSEGTASADGLGALGPGALAAVHACRADDDRTRAPLRVVEALTNQLATRFPVFQAALTQGADSVQIRVEHLEQHVGQVTGGLVAGVVVHVDGMVPARAAFEQLLRRPLEALVAAEPSRPIVLLVDALDETLGYPDPDGLVGLLSNAGLPEQVRLLLTSRPDPRIIEALGPPNLDLIADQPDGIDDLHTYALVRLDHPAVPAALDDARRRILAGRITAAGQGNFLYARYVLDGLLAEPTRLTRDPVSLDLPDGLAGIYAAFLDREIGRGGTPAREERWQGLYGPCLAS